MKDIYHRYLLDIENDNIDSLIYKDFLAHQSPNYLTNTSNKQKVIDFIAGMTDDYFVEQISWKYLLFFLFCAKILVILISKGAYH